MTAPEQHAGTALPAEPSPQCRDCINSTARDHVCLDGHLQTERCPYHEPLPY
ncbi:hypothetical protein [Paramagnetospirillum caucaseum]|uniref:hypothetical protein n=1 Tax=Paramagnetospirillum caucaseum TaxID=1244869 RepID=UPI000348958B|nr:hypothetical protein [Paramagnetospirillum caucaseum]